MKCTPLHLACMSGNSSLIRTLVQHGADTTLKDANGWTPMKICEMKKNQDLVDTLIECEKSEYL